MELSPDVEQARSWRRLIPALPLMQTGPPEAPHAPSLPVAEVTEVTEGRGGSPRGSGHPAVAGSLPLATAVFPSDFVLRPDAFLRPSHEKHSMTRRCRPPRCCLYASFSFPDTARQMHLLSGSAGSVPSGPPPGRNTSMGTSEPSGKRNPTRICAASSPEALPISSSDGRDGGGAAGDDAGDGEGDGSGGVADGDEFVVDDDEGDGEDGDVDEEDGAGCSM